MCFIRAYLRASTDEQDAARARGQVEAFATERGMQIASWYVENEIGATLARPELFRLLADAHPGDVLLVEQVDRLSRLGVADWERLKIELSTRKVRVVALDLPTSWMMATKTGDEFTGRMFEAINGMLLECSPRSAVRITRIAGAARCKVKPRRSKRASISAGGKTFAGITALPPCWPPARLTAGAEGHGLQPRTVAKIAKRMKVAA